MGDRRDRNRRLAALHAVPLFDACSAKELARIDGVGTTLGVPAGQVLTRQGGRERECFVVLEGEAVVNADGRTLGIIDAGSVAGEMSLLDGTARVATVVARTPMSVLVLTDRELTQLMRVAPSVDQRVHRLAAERQERNELAGAIR